MKLGRILRERPDGPEPRLVAEARGLPPSDAVAGLPISSMWWRIQAASLAGGNARVWARRLRTCLGISMRSWSCREISKMAESQSVWRTLASARVDASGRAGGGKRR